MTLRASRKRQGDVSLQDTVGTDGEGNDVTYMDILGTDADALEEDVIRRVTLERVHRVLSGLPARERLVLELRYGLTEDVFAALSDGDADDAEDALAGLDMLMSIEYKVLSDSEMQVTVSAMFGLAKESTNVA